jgi:hypothetical protein
MTQNYFKVTTAVVSISILGYIILSLVSNSVNLNFDDNCRDDMPRQLCKLGNIFGWLSGSLWYSCILAQLIKDAMITHCNGLSVIWAWLNFVAATLNCFAVFSYSLPMFSKVMAVYMPVLEAIVLAQIYFYRRKVNPAVHGDVSLTAGHWCVCSLIWTVAIVIGMMKQGPFLSEVYSWLAVIIWSFEGFFQIYVNLRRDSCDGQSFVSLWLMVVGKTSDLMIQTFLRMPSKYLLLAYFSSSVGYLNALQAVLMTKRHKMAWLRLSGILYLSFALVFVMPAILVFAPFEAQDSDWIRSPDIRWHWLVAPLCLAGVTCFALSRKRQKVLAE